VTIAISIAVGPEASIRVLSTRTPALAIDSADLVLVGDDADAIGTCDRLQVALGEIRDAAVRRLAERGTVRIGLVRPSDIPLEGAVLSAIQIVWNEVGITESEARLLDGNR